MELGKPDSVLHLGQSQQRLAQQHAISISTRAEAQFDARKTQACQLIAAANQSAPRRKQYRTMSLKTDSTPQLEVEIFMVPAYPVRE